MAERLVVAALSARMLAESARDAGYDVVALDVFGDRDTRAASVLWRSIRDADALRIDGARLAQALHGLEGSAWLAGAGCEPHLREAVEAADLPLMGNTPEVVAAVRDPRTFFDALRTLRIACPETRLDGRIDGPGWLHKDFAGSGGWHIHRAAPASQPSATGYFQREHAGEPISALFVADGRDARVLGVQRQLMRSIAGRPYVYCGSIGPIDLEHRVRREVERVVEALVSRFELRGLGSVDFLLDGDALETLEVNPRPAASMALYDRGGSMLRAHLGACRDRVLAEAPAVAEKRGFEIVFATDRARVDDRLASMPWRHDLPAAAANLERGDPVCTVSAVAPTEPDVRALLDQRRRDVLSALETSA